MLNVWCHNGAVLASLYMHTAPSKLQCDKSNSQKIQIATNDPVFNVEFGFRSVSQHTCR